MRNTVRLIVEAFWEQDRKSTRLNSSHEWISYAVFCLKKKIRDSMVELDGTDTVVHEYGITAAVDPATRLVTAIEAVPHVLPGPDCPNAASSALDVSGP